MTHTSLRILRYSFAILFFWFGYQQLAHPDMWTGFLPTWMGYIPIPAEMVVRLNGWVECIGAMFLSIGVYTRVVAAVLGAHLLFIGYEVGGAIGIRDAVLAMMGGALATAPPDSWTIDSWQRKQERSSHTEPNPLES